MTGITNIRVEAEAWVEDEIGRQRLGQDFGYGVMLSMAAVQAPQGVAQVPVWALLITARNPLLAEGLLFHGPVPVGSPRPDEKTVRSEVTQGLRELRDLAASKLAAVSGHVPAGRS